MLPRWSPIHRVIRSRPALLQQGGGIMYLQFQGFIAGHRVIPASRFNTVVLLIWNTVLKMQEALHQEWGTILVQWVRTLSPPPTNFGKWVRPTPTSQTSHVICHLSKCTVLCSTSETPDNLQPAGYWVFGKRCSRCFASPMLDTWEALSTGPAVLLKHQLVVGCLGGDLGALAICNACKAALA